MLLFLLPLVVVGCSLLLIVDIILPGYFLCIVMNTRSKHPTESVAGVFKLSFADADDSSSNQGRKRQFATASSRSAKSSRQRNESSSTFGSPQPESGYQKVRVPSSATTSSRVPASPAFNQGIQAYFKQSTPLHKTAERSARGTTNDRKRQESPMKSSSMYKTPEKKKRIYSSDEEELEFSPSGRRMNVDERRTLLQNATQWSARVDQEERFHGVYVRSVERLKRRLLSESIQSVETSTTCSDVSETSLDLSSYEVDEAVLTRRQKQIAYGKNTTEYEFYARKLDKMDRKRIDPVTPDKFDRVSRRRFDGRIRSWRIAIHRWYEQHSNNGSNKPEIKPDAVPSSVHVPVVDENTVTVQAMGGEGTMTEAPVARELRSPRKGGVRFSSVAQNFTGMQDESAVDAFQSPKKPATGKTGEVHTELTVDLAGFAICGNSQSTLTGPIGSNSNSSSSYQTRSRARLVFS